MRDESMESNEKGCLCCNRRQAIKLGVAGVAALALPACGGLANLAEPFTVPLADYPALANDGGVVFIPTDVSGGSHPVIVRRAGEDYNAMSAECNHFGCDVELKGEKFVCPCHDSEFGLDGALLQGPASEPLLPFTATADGEELTIGPAPEG